MPLTHIELEWKVDDLREAQEAAARWSTFIRYDGRGFGLSDRSATDFSVEAMVCDRGRHLVPGVRPLRDSRLAGR